ncbi:MAG: helix-turn-helix transcriptional regulator [Paludibacter sp.]|nr:helix-turn-helix transcriptional regulator [Paludibacter sp.]
MLQKQLASVLEIDTSMYSKMERGDRKEKHEQVNTLAKLLKSDPEEFLNLWLADQVYPLVKNEQQANRVLNIVQENREVYGK